MINVIDKFAITCIGIIYAKSEDFLFNKGSRYFQLNGNRYYSQFLMEILNYILYRK